MAETIGEHAPVSAVPGFGDRPAGQQATNGITNGNTNGNGHVPNGTTAKRPFPGSSPISKGQQNGGPPKKQQRPPKKKFKGRKPKSFTEGTAEEVLMADIQSLLATLKLEAQDEPEVVVEETKETATNGDAPEAKAPAAEAEEEELPEQGTEVDLEVIDLSSTGEALAVHYKGEATEPSSQLKKRIYVLNFAVPGDIVRAKVYRHNHSYYDSAPSYSVADFIKVVRPSPQLRDDNRIRCQYFGKCSGCQYQMLDYGEQLRIKRRVVERAYRHFSQLPPERVPPILDTVASPLQFGYRTKLTPHFDGPPGFRRKNKAGHTLTEVPDIGFMRKGGGPRTTLDIEQCPIGTPAVAAGMVRERARVAKDYATYSRGATILLRESTKRYPKVAGEAEATVEKAPSAEEIPSDVIRVETDDHVDIKSCITDNNATTTEFVDDYIFTNPAGSFFQNNNSILSTLTAYVRKNALPEESTTSTKKDIRYLIDAYSGSGLFTITLASTLPGGSIGIDIADQSIAYARTNAKLNNLAPDRCRFIAADAAQLFASVIEYDPDETVVVLDPPRKGCDAPFLRQLMAYGPSRIVYVSCNVHTQARDVGMLVRGVVDGFGHHNRERDGGGESGAATTKRARYEIESLRGFDFFPQTAHVEGIAVLNRVDE